MPKKKVQTQYKFPWDWQSIVKCINIHPDGNYLILSERQQRNLNKSGLKKRFSFWVEKIESGIQRDVFSISAHSSTEIVIDNIKLTVFDWGGTAVRKRFDNILKDRKAYSFRFPENKMGFYGIAKTLVDDSVDKDTRIHYEIYNKSNFYIEIEEKFEGRYLVISIKTIDPIYGSRILTDDDANFCAWAENF